MLQTAKIFEFRRKSEMRINVVWVVFLEQLGELSWVFKTEKDVKH